MFQAQPNGGLFSQGMFTIDPNATPEQLQRKREAIAALMPQYGTARSVGQGIGQLATGIMAGRKNRAIDEAEGKGRKEAAGLFAGLFGGGGASGGVDPLAGGASSTSASTAGGSASPVLPKGEMAGYVRAGLIERGLPEHVADGFVMNFQDESGLNPGINEASPLVPGSRGGFGLSQWTGPRRRELEAYAKQRGVDVSNPDMQMDFLMKELSGSEASAAKSILASQDSGSAAAAIVNKFLRPAEEHRSRREKRYLNGGNRPQQPQMDMQKAYQVLANPFISPAEKAQVQAMIAQQEKANDPLRQMQMQAAQQGLQKGALELEQMRNPAPAERKVLTGADGFKYYQDDGSRVLPGVQAPADPGFAQIPADEVAAMGLEPGAYQRGPDGKVSKIGGGGTSVIVNNAGDGVKTGAVPKGFAQIEDPNDPSGFRMVAIPGGPEDTSQIDARKQSNVDTASDTIVGAASMAREAAGDRLFGGVLGRVASNNPASENAELYRQVEVLKSNAKIGNLQSMREASKTGGALGSVTQNELVMLETQAGALDPQSPNFERDLDNYERTLLRVVHGKEEGDRVFEATRDRKDPASVNEMTREQFMASPKARAAAEGAGLTLDEFWEFLEGRK